MPEAKPFYLSIKPSTSRWHLWREVDEVNTLIRNFAESDEDIVYVDVATPMLGEDGTPAKELFVGDGLHLNAQGYELWTSVLGPHLMSVCGD